MIADSLRLRFVFATLTFVVIWNGINSLFKAGWIYATISTGLVLAADIIYLVRTRDNLFMRIFVFSLIAGFIELFADRWFVQSMQILVYPPGEPMIWHSPLYMPFAWTIVLVQLTTIGWWLLKHCKVRSASLAAAFIGAANIPLYEEWARGANWWSYRNTAMIGHTPWGIIIAEALIALTLPIAVRFFQSRRMAVSALLGVAQGFWMLAACVIAFQIIGFLAK